MFNCGRSLKTMPELPAETAVTRCYYAMFKECTSLREAVIPASQYTGTACCQDMFYACSKLSKITLGANGWTNGVFKNWVKSVAASGQFYKKESLSTVHSVNNIPEGWDVYRIESISAEL